MKAQRILAAAVFFLLLGVSEGFAADPEDKDWPCIQRKVPEVSAGMVWAGPPVEELGKEWQQDEQVSKLVIGPPPLLHPLPLFQLRRATAGR